MSTEPLSNLPTSLTEELQAALQSVDKAIAPAASNKIRTAGKVFTLPTGEASPGPLSGVILDFIQFNSFYTSAWDVNNPQPPACWAVGRDRDALTPSANAPSPQHTTCAGCPKDEYGSGSGKSKACKNQFRLIMTGSDLELDELPVYTLYVSPSGMKSWSTYVRKLKQEFNLLPAQAITEISFNPQASYPTLQFKLVGPHAHIEKIWALRNQYQDMLLREPELKE